MKNHIVLVQSAHVTGNVHLDEYMASFSVHNFGFESCARKANRNECTPRPDNTSYAGSIVLGTPRFGVAELLLQLKIPVSLQVLHSLYTVGNASHLELAKGVFQTACHFIVV